MDLKEFRDDFIEDIKAESVAVNEYEVEVFIDKCKDILINDYSLLSDLNITYIKYKTNNNIYRNMSLDASYFEESLSTLHLLCADYNSDEMVAINNEYVRNKKNLMWGFVVNAVKGYFENASDTDEACVLGREIRRNIDKIGHINFIIASTNIRSERLKTTFDEEPLTLGLKTFQVSVTILDIEAIYESKLPGFKKEDIEIKTEDFGIYGIPCIKADVNSPDYDSYLAVVPGKFLSDIYLKYSARLLESNVRSFLNTRGEINKGILNSILNDKTNFFAYNNGISTTADEVTLNAKGNTTYITSFKNLQIINGGQTTATLAQASLKKDKNGVYTDLNGIFVQMKLTLIKNKEKSQMLIGQIAKYANKQNKVTNADLTSNHQFYVRMEEFSRKITTPLKPNQTYVTTWFFERARGQYDQARMNLKEKEKAAFDLKNPKSQKFTKTDLAKYINSADMKPFDTSYGPEVNLTRFQQNMEDQWKKDNSVYNQEYYKDLIAKAIIYKKLESIVGHADWYKENKINARPQIVTYTFSKFVYEALKLNKFLNYKKIWDDQDCLDSYIIDLENISKLVFDVLTDPNRQYKEPREYAKRKVCWDIVKEKPYVLSDETIKNLITKEEKDLIQKSEKSYQKNINSISSEIDIFNLGINYWENVKSLGEQLNILNPYEISLCDIAIKYVKQEYKTLSKKQVKEIWQVKLKMDDYVSLEK